MGNEPLRLCLNCGSDLSTSNGSSNKTVTEKSDLLGGQQYAVEHCNACSRAFVPLDSRTFTDSLKRTRKGRRRSCVLLFVFSLSLAIVFFFLQAEMQGWPKRLCLIVCVLGYTGMLWSFPGMFEGKPPSYDKIIRDEW